MKRTRDKGKKRTKAQLERIMKRRQIDFCHLYIRDWNGTRAYMRVYDVKQSTARNNASRTLAKVYIKEYIELIRENIAEEAGISKLALIEELKNLAFSNIEDLQDDWITKKDFDSLPRHVKAAIQEQNTKTMTIPGSETREEKEVEYVKIKLYDKTKAIQDILKAMGWNEPEKIEHTGDVPTSTVIILPSNNR